MMILLRFMHKVSWWAVCAGCMLLGVALWQGVRYWDTPQNVNSYVSASYSARVIEVVEYRAASSRYVVELFLEGKQQVKVVVDSAPFPRLVGGDVVTVTCKPELIVDKSTVYWRQKNVWYRCSRAVVDDTSIQAGAVSGSLWWGMVHWINRGVFNSWSHIQQVYAFPYADLLVSMTIGMPIPLDEYSDALRAAGLSHTVSVSGYNLTIVVSSMFVLFPVHWRKLRFATMIVLLIAFVVGAGFSSPVLRAAGMIGWQRVGTVMNRTSSIFNALIWSVVLSLLFNPSELYSLSLYLSTAALLGIVLIGPILNSWLHVLLVKVHVFARSLRIGSQRWREHHFYPATVKPQKIVAYSALWQEIHKVSWYRIPSYIASTPKAIQRTSILSWCEPWRTIRAVGQEVVIPTTAATITTFGLIATIYKSTTVWFLVGNLLCLWVVPIITIFGLALLGIGVLCSVWNGFVFALYLGLPVIIPLIEYFLEVIQHIESLPGTAIALAFPSWATVLVYIGIVLFTFVTYPLPQHE